MTHNIQIYTTSVKAEADGNEMLVTLFNVDISSLVAEFPAESLLQEMDKQDILDYIESDQDDE